MRTRLARYISLGVVAMATIGLAQSAQPRFSLSISTPHYVVTSGDEVKIRIILKNISDEQIMLPKSNAEDQGEFHYEAMVYDEHSELLHGKRLALGLKLDANGQNQLILPMETVVFLD